LLPSAHSPVTWLGYFWDEANDLLGREEAQRAMDSCDLAALRRAGVRISRLEQQPGDLVVTHPFCVHMVLFEGVQAAHLVWFLDKIRTEHLRLFVQSFGKEACHLPLCQYDRETNGALGLREENEALDLLAGMLNRRGFLVAKLHDANLRCQACERTLDRFSVGRVCLVCFVSELAERDAAEGPATKVRTAKKAARGRGRRRQT
jgi:hypothetical protein